MFTLTTLLPAVYTERPPRWMPNFIYKNFKSDFVAACGQFFAIQKATYKAINGHEAVKNQVVEDVELGRILREKKDFSLVMKTELARYTVKCMILLRRYGLVFKRISIQVLVIYLRLYLQQSFIFYSFYFLLYPLLFFFYR